MLLFAYNSNTRMCVNNLLNTSKTQFSEPETAQMLGLTVDQLRLLVRNHIVKDEALEDPPMTTYQPTDVVLLRILARLRPAARVTA